MQGVTDYSAVGVSVASEYTAPAATTTSDGFTVTDLYGPTGGQGQARYQITVPANMTKLTFTSSAGTSGNVDLYVNEGTIASAPATTSSTIKGVNAGNAELIEIPNPGGKTFNILAYGVNPYSGVTLQAKYSGNEPCPGEMILTNGQGQTIASGSSSCLRTFKIDVPANTQSLTFSSSGGPGNITLYANVQPATAGAIQKVGGTGATHTMTINSPAAGTFYLIVEGNSSTYSNVTVKATYAGPDAIELRDRKDVLINGSAGSEQLYRIDVPSGLSKLVFMTSGGKGANGENGDLKLYMKHNEVPTVQDPIASKPIPATEIFFSANRADRRNNATYQKIIHENPQAGTYYLLVKGGTLGFSKVNLRARFDYPLPMLVGDDRLLYNGLPAQVDTTQGDKIWKFYAPQGVDLSSITFDLSSGSGDANIYVQKGTAPSIASNVGKSEKVGAVAENVTISAPVADPGIYYVLVKGATSGATLTAKWNAKSIKFGMHAHRLYNGNGENYNDAYQIRQKLSNETVDVDNQVDDWGIYTPGGNWVHLESADCQGTTCRPDRSALASDYPKYPYSSVRHWDIETIHDAVTWQSNGTIDFTKINDVYDGHASVGAKILKTFALTPHWASKRKWECNGSYPSFPGSASGPADLAAYKKFVLDYVTRAYENGWLWAVEGWNEPYSGRQYPVPSSFSPSSTDWDTHYYPKDPAMKEAAKTDFYGKANLWPCMPERKWGGDNNESRMEFTTMTYDELALHQKAIWEATKEVDPTLLVFSPANAYVRGIHNILTARTKTDQDPIGEPITKYFDVLGWHAYTKRAESVVLFTESDTFSSTHPEYPREGLDREVKLVKDEILLAKNAGVPVSADIPLADTEHGWYLSHAGGPWWFYNATDAQRGSILFDTARRAKELGLLGIWWYGHDNGLLGKPQKEADASSNSPISNALKRMYEELEQQP